MLSDPATLDRTRNPLVERLIATQLRPTAVIRPLTFEPIQRKDNELELSRFGEYLLKSRIVTEKYARLGSVYRRTFWAADGAFSDAAL
jgi:hypothetical protein